MAVNTKVNPNNTDQHQTPEMQMNLQFTGNLILRDRKFSNQFSVHFSSAKLIGLIRLR